MGKLFYKAAPWLFLLLIVFLLMRACLAIGSGVSCPSPSKNQIYFKSWPIPRIHPIAEQRSIYT